MRECLRKSRFCAGDTQKAYDRVLIWQWKISVTIGKAVTLRCSVKKTILKNPGKFTRKHLFQDLFFNKAAGLRHSSTGIFL